MAGDDPGSTQTTELEDILRMRNDALTYVTEEMRAAQGQWGGTRTAPPITETDIRRYDSGQRRARRKLHLAPVGEAQSNGRRHAVFLSRPGTPHKAGGDRLAEPRGIPGGRGPQKAGTDASRPQSPGEGGMVGAGGFEPPTSTASR